MSMCTRTDIESTSIPLKYFVPRLPPLPTPGANESQQQGQPSPMVGVTFVATSAGTLGTDTPPPMIVLNSAASAASSISNNGMTEAATCTVNVRSTLSPAIPNFLRPQSDDSSLLSGDDENAWDCEADKVMASAHDREEQDEHEADNMNDRVHPPIKVLGFDQLWRQFST